MNLAATDALGIIVSIVEVDDAWWTEPTDAQAVLELKRRGFDYRPLASVGPHEVERKIGGWAEFREWVATLAPA